MAQSGARLLGGRYQLVDRVGRGGMGTVWRAQDNLLGRTVAVKEILLPPGLDEEQHTVARDRALREARAAAQVRHPAVVAIHDVVIEDDHPWIVMDYIRARSLDDRLREAGALPVAEAARVGEALAHALHAVHDRGVVHRDLKPANVLLGDDGQVMLTDFGIATLEGDTRLTASGMLVGTPGYMAPERLTGQPVGPASDLWSLGAVLYTAVEGGPPFAGSTPMMVSYAVLSGDPAPPRQAGPLSPLITALLARNPADRPDAPTTAARLAPITATPAGETTAGQPPSPEQPQLPPPEPSRPTAPAGYIPTLRPDVPPPAAQTAAHTAAGKPPRKRKTPALLITAAAAVVLATVITVLVASSGDAVHNPDPCTVLTPAQTRELVPGQKKEHLNLTSDAGDGCIWNIAGSSGPELYLYLATYSSTRQAADALADRQSKASIDEINIPGLGNQSYADATHGETVEFRRNKHVVRIEYTNAADTKHKAIQAARRVDAKLKQIDHPPASS